MGIREDIEALARGELDLDALKRRVEGALSDEQESAGDILVALSDEHEQGNLSSEDYTSLTRFVTDTVTPAIDDDDSLTRLDTSFPTGDEEGDASVDIGTRLRDRFILDEVVGVGGMGTVYRGRDVLKIEAKDRNPYVAVKVLNDSFKQRPDAFIALQREASRQQRLAHPNIATVYDFDRSNGVMYITMEYLDGQTLDAFLKDKVRDQGGIPFAEALPIVQGLSAALSYAHERGIVHADFKPGNCFITEAQGIKVLDFGIARAMKDPNAAAADHTLFDPRSIGALTPAYASPEMLADSDGADPRDDIYALACVTYELLSGKHPFHRIPADQAKANDLKPARIKQLSRRQNDALARGLAFERMQRTPSATQFLAELSDEGSNLAFSWRLLALAATAVFAIAAAILVPRIIEERQFQTIQGQLLSGDMAQVTDGLTALEDLDSSAQARMLQESRQPLLNFFSTEFEREVAEPAWEVDYDRLNRLLESGQGLFPDSAALGRLSDTYRQSKDTHLSDLANRFETYLAPDYLIPAQNSENLPALLLRLQQVDPASGLLLDTRIAGAYASATEQALESQDYTRAGTLIEAGQTLMPDDPVLADLSDRLQGIQQRIALAEQIEQRERRLREAAANIDRLDDLPTILTPLQQLRDAVPDSTVTEAVAANLNTRLSNEFSERLQSQRLADIEALASIDASWRALNLQANADRRADRQRELETQQDTLVANVRRELERTNLTALQTPLDQLSMIDAADPRLPALYEEIIDTLRLRAQSLAAQQQWDSARTLLTDSAVFARDATTRSQLRDDAEAISELESAHSARVAAAAQQAEQDRQEALRRAAEEQRRAEQLARERVIAGNVRSIDAALAGLSSKAPLAAAEEVMGRIDALRQIDASHPRVTSARTELERRVRELIDSQPDSRSALTLLSEARQVLGDTSLYTDLARSLNARQEQEQTAALRARVEQAERAIAAALAAGNLDSANGQRNVSDALARLRGLDGVDATTVARQQTRIVSAYAEQIEPLIDARRFSVAADMLTAARRIDSDDAMLETLARNLESSQREYRAARAEQERQARLDALQARFDRELSAKQLTRAGTTLSEYRELEPDAAFLNDAPERLASALAAEATRMARSNQTTNAGRLLQQGRALAPDDARWAEVERTIEAAQLRLRVLAWFNGTSQRSMPQIRDAISTLRDTQGNNFTRLVTTWEAAAGEHLRTLQGQREAHNRFLADAQALLPSSRVLRQTSPIAAPAAPAPIATPRIDEPPVPAPTPAAPSAPSTLTLNDIAGRWCGDNMEMIFSANTMTFNINRQRIDYSVTQYEYTPELIRVFWNDRRVGDMIFEFNDFSSNGMTQVRGRKADSRTWQNYNRALKRCS